MAKRPGQRGGASAAARRRMANDRKWDDFVDRMRTLLRLDEDDVLETFGPRREASGRINRLRVLGDGDAAVLDELRRSGVEVAPLPWFADGFTFTVPRQQVAESGPSRRGEVFVQNASSFLPVLALAPQRGERILDACAAPGGKTSMIAALTGNDVQLWANDGIASRIENLRDVQQVLGFQLANVTTHPTQYLDKFVDETFDRILLDAQCSGEGMIDLTRRDALAHWAPERMVKYRHLQTKMLTACFKRLRPGGVLVYSTCTLSPEEDEAPVSTLLARNDDAVVEPVTLHVPNAMAGTVKWRGEAFHEGVRGALRVRPEGAMEGFFLCRIRKLGGDPADAVATAPFDLATATE